MYRLSSRILLATAISIFTHNVGVAQNRLAQNSSQQILGSWDVVAGSVHMTPADLTAIGERIQAEKILALTQIPSRCTTPPLPAIFLQAARLVIRSSESDVTIYYPEFDVERTVYLRAGAAPEAQADLPYGVSFGRWENETLAVFTLYLEAPELDGLTPLTNSASILERFSPSLDTNGQASLTWQAVITDPTTLNTESEIYSQMQTAIGGGEKRRNPLCQ